MASNEMTRVANATARDGVDTRPLDGEKDNSATAAAGTGETTSVGATHARGGQTAAEYWRRLDLYVWTKGEVWRRMTEEERKEEWEENDGSEEWIRTFYGKMCEKYGFKWVDCPTRSDYALDEDDY